MIPAAWQTALRSWLRANACTTGGMCSRRQIERAALRALVRSAWLAALACAALAVPCSDVARAHPLSPVALSLRELAPGRYEILFRRSQLARDRLTLDWPRGCHATHQRTRAQGDQTIDELELTCAAPLQGQTLRVFGLVDLGLSAIVHYEPHARAQAEPVRALLTPDRPSFVVPSRSSSWEVLRDYVGLGVAHLISGLDHVLFVAGLLLLLRGLRAKLAALTAFTLGHSVTLCLSALAFVRLPEAPVEIGIAASLVVLALELLERRAVEPGAWRGALMAFTFGLLHGLGFAGALAETGLPPHAVPLALFGFNLGVELGQLALVLALAPLLLLAKRVGHPFARRSRDFAAYAIGALAAMWCIERALALAPEFAPALSGALAR